MQTSLEVIVHFADKQVMRTSANNVYTRSCGSLCVEVDGPRDFTIIAPHAWDRVHVCPATPLKAD